MRISNAQAVVLANKLYVGGGDTQTLKTAINIYSYDLTGDNTWRTLESPARQSALAAFHGRLVLVGGVNILTLATTEQLWVKSDGQTWDQPLPPMPTPPWGATAVSTEEHLIVAGGQTFLTLMLHT